MAGHCTQHALVNKQFGVEEIAPGLIYDGSKEIKEGPTKGTCETRGI